MTATCPICESSDLRAVRTFTAAEAAQHFVTAEQDLSRHERLAAVIASLWRQDEATSRQCNGCQFGFIDPFVAGDGQFYQLAFGESGYSNDKWEFQRTLRALSGLDCRNWTVLEIGAGGGFFLDQLGSLGIPAQRRFATEYNETAARTMAAKGYTVDALEIEELDRFGETFDAIFMFQVLEHRDRLDAVFAKLRDLLKPGGQLFVAVPNGAAIRFNEDHGSLIDAPPNHVSQWRPEHFRIAAERFGFTLVAAEIEPFRMTEFVKRDVVYAFMRKAQERAPVAGYLYARRKRKIGRAAIAVAIAANAITRLPLWIGKRKELERLGPHLWVQMARPVQGPAPAAGK